MDRYGKEKLVIRHLKLDRKKVLSVDESISCGEPCMCGEEPFMEYNSIWEHFLSPDAEAFIVQTFGDSMIDADIEAGDRVIFEAKDTYNSGDIVLAYVNDEPLIKYLYRTEDEVWLVPGNDKYKPLRITPSDNFRINGRLVQILKSVKKDSLKIAKLVMEEKKKLPFVKVKKEFPYILCTKRARAQLIFLVSNNLLTEDWQPVEKVPLWQLGGIADKLAEVLGIEDKWNFFYQLWSLKNKDTFRIKWTEEKNTFKERDFTKNILNKIR